MLNAVIKMKFECKEEKKAFISSKQKAENAGAPLWCHTALGVEGHLALG
jgi:hypothetical protein